MAVRAFNFISVNPCLIEATGFHFEDSKKAVHLSRLYSENEENSEDLNLKVAEGVAAEGWAGIPAVLVFPSTKVSFRKLDFPFRDEKKIASVLPFELEDELLEGLDTFAFDFGIVSHPDGSATASVFLVQQDYLDQLIQTLESQKIITVGATFSAQALALSHPPESENHFQIYAGFEESFISHISGHTLTGVKSLPFQLSDFLPEGTDLQNPEKILSSLLAKKLSKEWKGIMNALGEGLTQQVNQFIQMRAMGEILSISIHGVLAPFFQWNAAEGKVEPATEKGQEAPQREQFIGILADVSGNPDPLTGSGGVNFHRRGIGYKSQFLAHRKPLLLGAGLIGAILLLLLTSFITNVVSYKSKINQLNSRIELILKKALPGNKLPLNIRIKVLEEKAGIAGDQNGHVGAFEDYNYDIMNLLKDISELYKNAPNLTLETLSVSRENIIFSGTTQSYNDSETFKNALGNLPRFAGKDPKITHQRSAEKITYRIVVGK